MKEHEQAAIDTELLALLAKRGPHASDRLVLDTVSHVIAHNEDEWLQWKVLNRWDSLKKDWS